ncbi:TetR family transcriptional regulator [Vibrio maerlii]|uniref:TetR family transcriptional regulator n=1 Tax=Vibrio maerlii TaxID=2231648 RepID=UPI000E3ECAB3|nr:TetR family transcriptional regulator [Vibrio maerlii]
MPKRSKEDTLITINTILDEATNQLLNVGYDDMSYTTLSKATGISRTGISHHFPKKTDFTQALKGRFLQMFMSHLNISATEKEFVQSWESALLDQEFASICHLIIHQVTNDSASEFASSIIEQIKNIAFELFNESGKKSVEWLLGMTMASIALSTATEKAA